MNLYTANPRQLDKLLAAAEKKLAEAQKIADEQRQADAAKANNEAAEVRRAEQERQAEEAKRAHVTRQLADAAAQLDAAKRSIEQQRRHEMLEQITASEAAITLLDRAYAEALEFGDLDAALRGGVVWADGNKRGRVEAQRAMRIYLGLDVPAELWQESDGGLTAKLRGFLGLNWSAGFSVGEGSFLQVEIPGHGAWQQVYSPGALAELCERFPSLKAALPARSTS